MSKMGGWEIAAMGPCALPQNVANGFESVSNLRGAKYTPVLYCGKQLVNGTNYMLICKQTLVTENPEEHVVKMILHETLSGGGDSFSILQIEPII